MTEVGAWGLAIVGLLLLAASCATAEDEPTTENEPHVGFAGGLALLLWAGFLISTPFYVFDSGLPQPSDFCLVALIGLVGLARGVRFSAACGSLCRCMAMLVAYVAFVNSVWAIALRDASVLTNTIYFVFNLLAVVTFANLDGWLGRRFATWTAVSVVLSVLIQAALATLMPGDQERCVGFFNNPNQLGYYTILYGSLFWIASSRLPWTGFSNGLVQGTFYLSLLYISALSMSRACLVSSGLLVAASLFQRPAALLLAVLGLAIAAPIAESQLGVFSQIESRVDGTTKDFLGELRYRGYDRIWNHPQYLAFGAGEGKYTRFNSYIDIELHSSIGTLLFCYGVVGLSLFVRMVIAVVGACGWGALWRLTPVLAYGLTHNGLRQTEFWLIAALIVCVYTRSPQTSAEHEMQPNTSYAPAM